MLSVHLIANGSPSEAINHLGTWLNCADKRCRTKVSDIFRNGKGLIMFSSDVSARGVDYPDVTLVVQVMCLLWSAQ